MDNVHDIDRLKIQSYVGPTLRANSTPPECIIESLLWTEDAVMLLGSEKAGKSIAAQQMLVHITSGEPFMGKYAVRKPGPVVYIQAEGKRDEFVSRLNNMAMAMDTPLDDSSFLHIFKKYCPLNVPIFLNAVIAKIDAQVAIWGRNPVAICVDSVYKAMEGDLNENRDVIGFTNAIDTLIARYNAAILLIHHDAKEWRDDKLKVIDRGDKGAYGSVFLRAYVDHILYLKMSKDKTRTLSCDTQRSGATEGTVLELVLVQPTPLCFQIKGDYRASSEVILHQLRLHPQTSYSELMSTTGMSLQTIRNAMAQLIQAGTVVATSSPQSVSRTYSLK